MTAFRRILVPIDFSQCSRHALEYAASLSERFLGAPLDVLHVWEPPRYVGSDLKLLTEGLAGTSVEQLARDRAAKDMADCLADIERRGVVKTRRLHETGDPVRTIIDVAANGEYDLIVMGTHGRTGVARHYLGSVAERVVRHATCPVLTVRTKPDPSEVPDACAGVVPHAATRG